ncbi:hypothetical protein Tcan_08587 [Toxocara canis]|uniref:Uncharacterized protein n=1 Tax=Toxocara canis TaxID=6265 RepID=A0A0B2UYW4_TOXCA|nr:hypothetical protein Tcan_08587 [Toxocara canis]
MRWKTLNAKNGLRWLHEDRFSTFFESDIRHPYQISTFFFRPPERKEKYATREKIGTLQRFTRFAVLQLQVQRYAVCGVRWHLHEFWPAPRDAQSLDVNAHVTPSAAPFAENSILFQSDIITARTCT